jgi:polar amino acid transport system substrate-binding protein
LLFDFYKLNLSTRPIYFFFFCFTFSNQAFSNQDHINQLDMAVGLTKPPYVISEGDTGFEIDLIKAVFANMNFQINSFYVPYGRSYAMLKNSEVDLTLTLNHQLDIDSDMLSDVYVTYQNAVISLTSRALKITAMDDLQGKSVVGFQNASWVLGKSFREAVKNSPLYIELPNQKRQVEMLLLGNVDAVVMDINIFNHFSRVLTGSNQMAAVSIHRLFPASDYHVGFKDINLKKQFNVALADYLSSDDYIKLRNKYNFIQ